MQSVSNDAASPFPPFSRRRRLQNRLKNYFTDPYNIIMLVSVAILCYLIVVPLVQMIGTTFTMAKTDLRRVRGAVEGQFTLYYWKRLLASDVSRNLFWIPLRNSLVIAVCTSALSILIGSLVAWLLVRTDLPGKRFFSLAVIVPYMLPSWCKSMAWLTVFRNETIGGAAGFLSYFGINAPDRLAYGPLPIVLVLSIHYYAYAYLLVSAALRSINSELEEMGEIVGASKGLMLRKITFPLVPRTGADTLATPGSRSPTDCAQPRRLTADSIVALKRAPIRPRCRRSGSSHARSTWAAEPPCMDMVAPTGMESRRPMGRSALATQMRTSPWRR